MNRPHPAYMLLEFPLLMSGKALKWRICYLASQSFVHTWYVRIHAYQSCNNVLKESGVSYGQGSLLELHILEWASSTQHYCRLRRPKATNLPFFYLSLLRRNANAATSKVFLQTSHRVESLLIEQFLLHTTIVSTNSRFGKTQKVLGSIGVMCKCCLNKKECCKDTVSNGQILGTLAFVFEVSSVLGERELETDVLEEKESAHFNFCANKGCLCFVQTVGKKLIEGKRISSNCLLEPFQIKLEVIFYFFHLTCLSLMSELISRLRYRHIGARKKKKNLSFKQQTVV